jgi:hypothetical protein
MKKLATAFAFASLTLAAPVFACPNMDHDQAETPKTADKDSPKKDASDKDKATEAPKPATNKDQPPADTAKAKDAPGKPAPAPKKTGDKVSIK